MTARRVIAIVPAHNEQGAVGDVIDEIRSTNPTFDIVVIDDGSTDGTARVAVSRGAAVVRLPYNLGIGGAVQTGFRYALEQGFELAVRLDGDGQHDPTLLASLLIPIEAGDADIAIGSRFVGGRDGGDGYRPPLGRRIGITWFAKLVSMLTRQRVTDTTSGFQAMNRKGIALFARDYPNDYPEVEAMLLVYKHRLRLVEVPVEMRVREHGESSITFIRSIYYAIKVTIALLVAMARKHAVPADEAVGA